MSSSGLLGDTEASFWDVDQQVQELDAENSCRLPAFLAVKARARVLLEPQHPSPRPTAWDTSLALHLRVGHDEQVLLLRVAHVHQLVLYHEAGGDGLAARDLLGERAQGGQPRTCSSLLWVLSGILVNNIRQLWTGLCRCLSL